MSHLRIGLYSALVLVFFCFATPTKAAGQNKRKKNRKTEMPNDGAKTKSNKEEKRAAYNNGRDKHESIQDKKTRKRMKQTRNKSMINAGKKKLPFYKRWFRQK
jgi:hypothetical protein